MLVGSGMGKGSRKGTSSLEMCLSIMIAMVKEAGRGLFGTAM